MDGRTPLVLSLAAATAFTGLAFSADPANSADAAQPTTKVLRHSSFQAKSLNWYVSRGAALSRVRGHGSRYAAHVKATKALTAATLNDSPASVRSTVAGATYNATAYVRTPTPRVSVGLQLKEYSGRTDKGIRRTRVTLPDKAWHKVSVSYVAKTTGARLGVNVVADKLAKNRAFEVDDVALNVTPPKPEWTQVYRHDFTDLHDVTPFQSSRTVNSHILPTDANNSALQKPSLRSNVTIDQDPAAGDGSALGVHTRQGTYLTNSGALTGWTNGRMMISGQNQVPPVRIKTRLRMTASAKAKSAVMWWPSEGGWKWEVDFAETFGGTTTTDYWGSRQNVGQRWHGDVNGDGKATEQLFHDDHIDATQYHVYDLVIKQDRMWVEIDGVKRFETTNADYIPDGPGFFSIGKALTHRRDAAGRTDDTVFVDWLEIYKPTP